MRRFDPRDPDTYPDEFKSWVVRWVGESPTLEIPALSIAGFIPAALLDSVPSEALTGTISVTSGETFFTGDINVDGEVNIGTSGFFEESASVLRTNDALRVLGTLTVLNASDLKMDAGVIRWNDGSNPNDASIYRTAANVVGTGGAFLAEGNIVANNGDSGQVQLSAVGGTTAAIIFGSGGDASISRPSPAELVTDSDFHAEGNVTSDEFIYADASGAPVIIGAIGPGGEAAIDLNGTSLYRASAGVLQTSGTLKAGEGHFGNIKLSITAAAVSGAQSWKFPVYNVATGSFVGWVPIYAS